MPKAQGTLALASYEDIFQMRESVKGNTSGQIVELPLNELNAFENHPFKICEDESMLELVESIQKYGVLVPGIVRPQADEKYELIAGHRRKHGCKLAGKETMPVIVRELDDDEATIIMVDSNLQRESLLYSEKAWAYRMKLEAMNHRGRKIEGFESGILSVDVLAEQVGESKSQIFRYIRLTELVPDLLDMVDDGKIAFGPAVDLSYLSRKKQAVLIDTMGKYEATPSLSQAQRLKKYHKDGALTDEIIDEILSEVKKEVIKVTISGNKLVKFFPHSYTPSQMETVIFSLLEKWKKELGQDN